jgi:hypothetical protein
LYISDVLLYGGEKIMEYLKKPEEENLWRTIICPNCFNTLKLSGDELSLSGLHCPECDSFIVLLESKSKIEKNKNYIRLLSSSNQGNIKIIKSMLDNAEVDYYINGENFSGVNAFPGQTVFYINEKDHGLAKDILKDFELHLSGHSVNNEEEN